MAPKYASFLAASEPKNSRRGFLDTGVNSCPDFAPQVAADTTSYTVGDEEIASGRWTFLSADPLGQAASMSLYDFCAGDPVNSFDPTGMCPEKNNDFTNLVKAFDPNLGNLSSLIYNGNNSWNATVIGPDGVPHTIQDMRMPIALDDGTGRMRPPTPAEIAEGALMFDSGMRSMGQAIAQGMADRYQQQLSQATRTLDMLDSPEGRFTLTAEFGLGVATDWAMNAAGAPGLAATQTTAVGSTTTVLQPGSFSISDWNGYPESLPQPTGPFRLLTGEEYDAARAAANQANSALHASDESLAGWQLHEVQPVKFGGSPTDLANKFPLPADAHTEVTNWWNGLQRSLTYKGN